MAVDSGEIRLTLPAMQEWGRAFGRALVTPAVVTLAGDLGAGKTTLVRAIAEGLGVRDLTAVTSPTFAIVQEYSAPERRIVHADLYRLRSVRELDALGWDDIVAHSDVLLVEWPDCASGTLPEHTIALSLAHPEHDDECRLLNVQHSHPTP